MCLKSIVKFCYAKNGYIHILLIAWGILAFGSLGLFTSSIYNAVFSQNNKGWIDLYYISVGVLTFSLFLAILILSWGCTAYHISWSNGLPYASYNEFHFVYNITRLIRVGVYFEIVFSIILNWVPLFLSKVYNSSEVLVTYNWFFVFCFACNGAALAECSFQTSWIGTSRRTPSIGIAVANVILYFAIILDLICNKVIKIDLIIFNATGDALRSHLNNVFNSIPNSVKTGIIIATGIALLKDFVSQFSASISYHHPANLAQQRRHIRHRLLTHWNYKESVATFSRENFRAEFLTVNILIGAFSVLTVICRNAWNVDPAPDSLADGIVSMAIYSLIFMFFSFASLWSIRDETLIQSEHMYLSIKSIKLNELSIRGSDGLATPAWMDFCQVLCNLTSNVSGIDSEDVGYRNIAPMLVVTARSITNDYSCKRDLFTCDILRAKGNIQATLLRDTNHEKNESDASFYASDTPVQIARDLIFANLMVNLIETVNIVPKNFNFNCTNLYNSTPICFVNKLLGLFFNAGVLDFGSASEAYSISNKDIITLLKVDVFQYLFRYEVEQNNCGLSWLECPYICKNCIQQNDINNPNTEPKHVNINERNVNSKERELLILTLPFLIIDCFRHRWRKIDISTINALFLQSVYNYYIFFSDCTILKTPSKDIEHIALASFQRLLDSEFNLSIIETINGVIDDYLKVKTYLSSTATGNPPCQMTSADRNLMQANLNDTKIADKDNGTIWDREIFKSILQKRFNTLNSDCWIKAGLASNQWINRIDSQSIYGYWKRIVCMSFMKQESKKS